MTNRLQRPWAILLCRFNDDANDPCQTTLSTLSRQWLTKFGPAWLAGNVVAPTWPTDQRTILDLYNNFFTKAGTGTYNSVSFWDAVSHGSIDVSGSQVFPCQLDISSAAALNMGLAGYLYQVAIFKKAKEALANQYGRDWHDFSGGVAVSFQSPDYGTQGGNYDGGPGVYADIRSVRNEGMAVWGQEMGHAFGLQHSRQDGSADDYKDPWDVMSTLTGAFCHTPDPNYGLRGIGLNAWNMRGRQWLDESRIWKRPERSEFIDSIELRPLHRRDLPGYLGAELPGIAPDGPYLVEFRIPDEWDLNIPAATVLVHRFEDPHSYLEKGTKGQVALSVGDRFQVGIGQVVSAQVESIDVTNRTAKVRLSYSVGPRPKRLKPIPWWQWDPEKVQRTAGGYFRRQLRLIAQRVGSALRTLSQLRSRS